MIQQFIYLVRVDDTFKIGRTNHLQERLSNLKVANPNIKDYFAYYCVTDSVLLEKMLHTKFKDVHVRGEWFELTLEDLKNLESFISSKCLYKVNVEDISQLTY